jgi:hypothetical protein
VLINPKPLSHNKFQIHKKLTISLKKEKLLAILKIEESTMSMKNKLL